MNLKSGNINKLYFSVVDTETTGLYTNRHDRIIEIAIIRIDFGGKVISEYSTLINPERDIGPTHIHGLQAKDVIHAPTFEEIGGNIVEALQDSILVGHNILFDHKFIESEFNRLDKKIPKLPMLCTMNLAQKADPLLPSRKLNACCAHFGVKLKNAHSAYYDAVASSKLLTKCFNKLKLSEDNLFSNLSIKADIPSKESWPAIPDSEKIFTRKDSKSRPNLEANYLCNLINKLPSKVSNDFLSDSYLGMLDLVLEDRKVTEEEAESLFDLAKELGLSNKGVLEVHHQYLKQLVEIAWEDKVITESEMKDLDLIRNLLTINETTFKNFIAEVKTKTPTELSLNRYAVTEESLTDKKICFTGSFTCVINGEIPDRSFAEEVVSDIGMIVTKGVTKDLDYLIIADPDSMSGKAKKARKYGVRIIAEQVFWRMMGFQI
jgi:DNA polymerase-3 subunit epsilon